MAQARVCEYLERMAGVNVPAVHLVVDDIVRP
jgi:uncharacterized alkaline shock family protein YloU